MLKIWRVTSPYLVEKYKVGSAERTSGRSSGSAALQSCVVCRVGLKGDRE